jgi:hypothetical protein
MAKWTEIHTHLVGDLRAEVELMAMMWRQAAEYDGLYSTLVCNSWSISSMAQQLDYGGVVPDVATLEWLREHDGYPPPVPFIVAR